MSPIPTSLSNPNPKPYKYKAKPKSKQTPQDRVFLSRAPTPCRPVPILTPAQASQIIGNASISVVNGITLPFTGTIVGFIPDEPAPVEDILTQAWKMAELPYPLPKEIDIHDPRFPKTTFTVTHLPEIPRPSPLVQTPTPPLKSPRKSVHVERKCELGKEFDYLNYIPKPRQLGNKGKTLLEMKNHKFEILSDGTVRPIGPGRGCVAKMNFSYSSQEPEPAADEEI